MFLRSLRGMLMRRALLPSLLMLAACGHLPRERFALLSFLVPMHLSEQVSLYSGDCVLPPRISCDQLASTDAGWELRFHASTENPVDLAFWRADLRLADGRTFTFDSGREVDAESGEPGVWRGKIGEVRGEPWFEFVLTLEH